jgi:II/X family phage/plasmid replication protein
VLIDWLTIRIPLEDKSLSLNLAERIADCLGVTVSIDCYGVEKWRKVSLDLEALRSDSVGLFWTVTADAESTRYLSVGGSPSSILNQGVNVFGSLDIRKGAEVLRLAASKALNAILPPLERWQCRRIDVTANYNLGNSAQVKQALRLLLSTDAPRRRTNSDRKGGDSVYWNPSSDLRAAKAYHKGAHLRFQKSKGNIDVSDELLNAADQLLRLELKLGARWCRRLAKNWLDLTDRDLSAEHFNFFSGLIGTGLEVSDMGTLLNELEKVAPSAGQALAAHRTFALIKVLGYSQTKDSIPKATFHRHCSFLRLAGLSSADLCAGKVIELRRKNLVLGEDVNSWDELKAA